MTTEGEFGVMQPQVNECWQSLEARKDKEQNCLWGLQKEPTLPAP